MPVLKKSSTISMICIIFNSDIWHPTVKELSDLPRMSGKIDGGKGLEFLFLKIFSISMASPKDELTFF